MAPAPASGADLALDGDDSLLKSTKLAARAARFNNKLEGNRYKEVRPRSALSLSDPARSHDHSSSTGTY